MKRFLVVVVVVVAGMVGGCDKPSTDDCRAAISNMERLLGTDTTNGRTAENESEVRRCKGGSTRDAVACAKNANTLAQLKACDFMANKGQKK